MHADLGPRVKFGKVKIDGLARMPESSVRARVAWDEGDTFHPDAIRQTEGRLYAMGTFSSVRVDWEREGRPEVADVTIKVSEGARREVRLGFGAGLDRARWEARTRAGYTEHGIFGWPLTTLRLDVTPGYSWLRSADGSSGPSIEAMASLDRDDLLVPRLQGTALAAFQREPREGYILSGPRLNLSVSRPFFHDDALRIHAGWEIRYLSFIDADPMVFGPAATASRLAYYEQRMIFDRRDAPLDARRGFYAELTLNEGGAFAGGEESFVKAQAELRGYVPLHRRVVLAGRASAGRLTAFGDETPLPVRFYGGGATHHRGFGFHRLSPARRDAEERVIPIGGDDMLLASLEGRIDIFKLKDQWLSTAVFVDGGDLTSPPGAMDLGNLHWAVGLGLRYNTIIGPIRADLGIRLNRVGEAGADGLANPDPGARFAFHLSLGEAF
jgi:translocation and assembly module TamA